MNRTYALVWNPSLAAWTVTDERARRRGKGAGAVLAAALLLPLTAIAADLPTGGNVVSGSGAINQPNAQQMVIDQTSNKLAIDWQSFDIATGNKVTFNQPGSDAIALNRVLGADGSQIMGQLDANGRVFLINPNGVLFGAGAQVNVGGLVASTLNISDSDFAAGNYKFKGDGSNASVINNGQITAADGGSIALLGGTVSNNGVIVANQGSVALAAGNAVTLDFAGDGLLNVQVDEAVVDALVANHQLIKADGGQVLLTANAGDALLKTVVNNSGVIEAHTLGEKDGKIVLLGSFDGGTVQVAGTLDASAPKGGDGGFIETSGAHVKVADGAKVTTKATNGKTGTWLIDPNDFTIAASGDMSGAAVSEAVQSNNFEIQTATQGTTGGNGDIHVNDAITWNSANTLTLNAERNININAAITAQDASGKVALKYGQGSANGGTADYNIKAPINLQSGENFSTQKGSLGSVLSYTVVNDATALQAMNSNLGGNYALGSDIDLSSITNWLPVGNSSNRFTGRLDGLGHTLSNLTISRSGTIHVGLFGFTGSGSVIRDIGLVGGSVLGSNYVGGLVGQNVGTISNAYATGRVSGLSEIGGLVGQNVGTISNAYATGSVSASGDSVGGLVGYNYGNISNAYATGTVTGRSSVGGLVGVNYGNISIVGNISNAYATGTVTGTGTGNNQYVGGLVGFNYGEISNAYWDSRSTGQNNASGGGGSGTITDISSNRYNHSSYTGLGTWAPVTGTSNVYAASDSNGVQWIMIEGQTRPFLASEYSTSISNAHQLQLMAYNLGAHYTLAKNIDASATSGSNASDMWSTSGFVPVGDYANKFGGQINGSGHAIMGLTIDRSATDYVGLFGYTGSKSAIRDIGLLGGSVSGYDYVGGLVGYTYQATISNAYATGTVTGRSGVGGLVGINGTNSTISNAYATGSVSASGNTVGGLVGYNTSNGTISNAYATGTVTGRNTVGGLVGYNTGNGTISNAYATGTVTGDSDYSGGLVGYNDEEKISSSFYATTDAGGTAINNGPAFTGNSNGTGKTWAELNDSSTFVGWDFANTWRMTATGADTEGYAFYGLPTLQGVTRKTDYQYFDSGLGTQANPWTLTNWQQLQNINTNATTLGGHFTLNADLGQNSLGYTTLASATANGGAGWNPLGNDSNPFTGTFNGLSHTISDLVINRSGTSYVGLFGYTSGDSMIRDIGLVGGSVSGSGSNGSNGSNGGDGSNSYSGALVGYNSGTINNAYATGSVSANGGKGGDSLDYGEGGDGGDGYSGGLVGYNAGSINNAYATGSVSASGSGGGYSSYEGGDGGDGYSGGLVGYNAGSINNAYATGTISTNGGSWGQGGSGSGSGGAASGGGLVGVNFGTDTITASFYATTDADKDEINNGGKTNGVYSGNAYGTGKTWADLTLASTFTASAWDIASTGGSNAIWRIYDGHSGPLLRSFLQSVTLTADASGGSKTYNGTAATGTTTYTSSSLGSDLETSKLQGDLSYASTSKNAGTYSSADGSLILSGLYSGQQGYDISYADTSLTIAQKALTVSGMTASSKVYDGTTSATLSGGILNGLVSGETLSLGGATGVFADKNAANGKAVTVTGTSLLDGTGLASNYTVSNPTGVTGNITPKALTIDGMSVLNKVYDGSTQATLSGGSLSGLVGSETLGVTGLTATFDDKNAGTGKTVTATGSTLVNGSNGGLAANYTISNPTGLTANITQKALTITGLSASDKVYDGNTGAALVGGTLSGLITGETLVLNGMTGTFSNKNAGTGKTVTVSGATLADGTGLASNYTVAQPVAVTANINKATLTLSGVVADSKTYDGSNAATLSNVGTLDGLVSGETLTLSQTGAVFADKNAGTAKTVTASGYGIADGAGGLASNYQLASTTATTTANINKATLTITANDASKIAGQSIALSGYSASGLVGNDSISAVSLNSLGQPTTAAAGNYAIVASDALGAALSNYDISYQDGTLLVSPVAVATPSTANSQLYIGAIVANNQTVAAPESTSPASEPEVLNPQMLITNPLADIINLQVINQGIRLPEGI